MTEANWGLMFENLGQWLKPAPQVTARAIPLSALFWPASLSDNADLKFHREKLNYQGKDRSGLPVYHNSQGHPIDVLTLHSNTVMLPNGIGLTWTPEKPPEIGIEGYPDDPDAQQVIIYTTPISEASGPISLELPATEGELIILWSPEAHRGVPVYYSEKVDSEDSSYSGQSDSELANSKRSYEKLLDEHQEKLDNYLNNPDAFDHKGLLKDVSSDMRLRVISGRAESLRKQIKKQQGELKKILKELENRGRFL